MDTILNPDEYTEVEGRAYLNPQVGLDESTSFIENLRASQGQQNQEIAEQTRMLGTDVPSNLGGLIGGESYFTSRYRTPQTASTIANLRATAQAKALNDVLANEQAMWKKRYQDAYRNYQKRQNTPSTTPQNDTIEGGVEYEDTGLTGLTAKPDTTEYYTNTEIITVPQPYSRANPQQNPEKHTVVTDKSGNVLSVDGTYGREARARYRRLQQQNVVRGKK